MRTHSTPDRSKRRPDDRRGQSRRHQIIVIQLGKPGAGLVLFGSPSTQIGVLKLSLSVILFFSHLRLHRPRPPTPSIQFYKYVSLPLHTGGVVPRSLTLSLYILDPRNLDPRNVWHFRLLQLLEGQGEPSFLSRRPW